MARIIDTDNKNLIGNKVKILRKKKHMSQQQLSDKLETLVDEKAWPFHLYLSRFHFQN